MHPFKPSPRQIMARCAAEYGVTVDDILRRDRTQRITWARQEAMRQVRATYPTVSLPWVAKHFQRDRSTVQHALGRAKPTRQPSAGREIPKYPVGARLLRAELVRILHAEGWPRHQICNAVNLSMKRVWEMTLPIEGRPVPEGGRRLADIKEAA